MATTNGATTFVHLTDTHIYAEAGGQMHGVDTMAALRDTLAMLRERHILPETPVVISGDLAEGEPESYTRLRAVIEALRADGTTVHLALGNHDNRAVFRSVMLGEPDGDGAAKYHYTAMLGGLRLIVLDSHELGTHAGVLGAAQLAWLKGELATAAPEGTVIVVHHPPTPAPLPIQAGIMLQDADALREVIAGTDVVGILSGHTHVSAIELFGGVPSVTTPGTAALNDILFTEGRRRLDGGAIALITVRDRVMMTKPLPLPRSGRELYRHLPADTEA